jgi:hypothetical protein
MIVYTFSINITRSVIVNNVYTKKQKLFIIKKKSMFIEEKFRFTYGLAKADFQR